MKYIALFRGINVGGNKKVSMKELKFLLEKIGYNNIATYINSGNVIFESDNVDKDSIKNHIEEEIKRYFGFEINILIKTGKEILEIYNKIPSNWNNNDIEKTDIAYLFPEIDSSNIVENLPVKKEFMDILYIPGALIFYIKRENLNKSQIAKLAGHKLYKFMTIRNVNTARFLGENSK